MFSAATVSFIAVVVISFMLSPSENLISNVDKTANNNFVQINSNSLKNNVSTDNLDLSENIERELDLNDKKMANAFNTYGSKFMKNEKEEKKSTTNIASIDLNKQEYINTEESTDIFKINPIINGGYSSRPNTNYNPSSVPLDIEDIDTESNGTKNVSMLPPDLDSIVANSQSHSKTMNRNFLLIIISAGFVWAIYYFNKRPALSDVSRNNNSTLSPGVSLSMHLEKALEVEQKMDGTVIIYHNNKEFKVSKPELNSETDRFIQRILELIDDETKEIEYDILKDNKLNLNSPLSKIVTRLGFVGLKRDLFFPRTSKNKVVFRKFITKTELSTMDVDLENIESQLIN
jgi:hypothetical protein